MLQDFLLMLPFKGLILKVERDGHLKYFLPRVNITNHHVLIDGRNFYDQPINDQIKKYSKIRKIATRKGDDYTTGCLLDYQDHCQLILVNLSKQKSCKNI